MLPQMISVKYLENFLDGARQSPREFTIMRTGGSFDIKSIVFSG